MLDTDCARVSPHADGPVYESLDAAFHTEHLCHLLRHHRNVQVLEGPGFEGLRGFAMICSLPLSMRCRCEARAPLCINGWHRKVSAKTRRDDGGGSEHTYPTRSTHAIVIPLPECRRVRFAGGARARSTSPPFCRRSLWHSKRTSFPAVQHFTRQPAARDRARQVKVGPLHRCQRMKIQEGLCAPALHSSHYQCRLMMEFAGGKEPKVQLRLHMCNHIPSPCP